MALFGNKCYFCPCERKTQNNMKTLLHIVVYILSLWDYPVVIAMSSLKIFSLLFLM